MICTLWQGNHQVEGDILLFLLPFCQGKDLDAQLLGGKFQFNYSQELCFTLGLSPSSAVTTSTVSSSRMAVNISTSSITSSEVMIDSCQEVGFDENSVLQQCANSGIELLRIIHTRSLSSSLIASSGHSHTI